MALVRRAARSAVRRDRRRAGARDHRGAARARAAAASRRFRPETKLRDVFVTERGDAFVDLSARGQRAAHAAARSTSCLTVYTIVDALTVNLPAITRVQILIDGKEVDTLAGHVDLRHPLAKSLQWVVHDTH